MSPSDGRMDGGLSSESISEEGRGGSECGEADEMGESGGRERDEEREGISENCLPFGV